MAGCPGDDGGGADTGGSDGSGTAESTSTTASTSSASQSETSAGTSTQSSTSAGTGEASGDTGPDGSSGGSESADGSTGGDACVGLPRKECVANRACAAITCSPFQMSGDPGNTPWCLADPEFVGCQSADIGCDDVRTVACEGNDSPVFACPSSCIPDGWTECDPPAMGDIPMCG